MKKHDKYAAYEKYSRRVGGVVPTERLAWVFRVLNPYRTHQGADWLPGDWDNVRSELAVFSGLGDTLPEWAGPLLEHGEIAERPSMKEAEAILARMHQMVDDAEHHRPFSTPPLLIKKEFKWDASAGRYQPHTRWEDMDRATWLDRVRYALASLLNAEGHRIQRCPAKLAHEGKRCANYFLKSKRQKYCSKTCTSREMTRAKRQRDAQPKPITRTHTKGGKSHGAKRREG